MPLKPLNVAMPTPINLENKIELPSIGELLAYYQSNGLSSILICGSTGEQHSLKLHEKLQMIDYLDQLEHGSLELIFGVSSVFYDEAIDLVKRLAHSSVDAIMLGFPPYIRLSQSEAIAYAESICRIFKKEVLIYNNPGRTGFDLSPDSLKKLVTKNPNIVGIKEAGNSRKVSEIRNLLGDQFQVFYGGEVNLLCEWEKGFNGLSSIIANLYPIEVATLLNELKQGEWKQAEAIYSFIHEKNKQLLNGSFLPNLKYVMTSKGLPVGQCRSPLGFVEEHVIEKVEFDHFF